MSDTPAPTPTADLIDAHGSHMRQHGATVDNVIQYTAVSVQRGRAYAFVSSSRAGRRGELPIVTLHISASPMGAYFDMTPDDADAMAANLHSAAQMARDVRALLGARA